MLLIISRDDFAVKLLKLKVSDYNTAVVLVLGYVLDSSSFDLLIGGHVLTCVSGCYYAIPIFRRILLKPAAAG